MKSSLLFYSKIDFSRGRIYLKGQIDKLLVSVSHTTHLHNKQVHIFKVICCCWDLMVSNYGDFYPRAISSSKWELWVVASRFLLDVEVISLPQISNNWNGNSLSKFLKPRSQSWSHFCLIAPYSTRYTFCTMVKWIFSYVLDSVLFHLCSPSASPDRLLIVQASLKLAVKLRMTLNLWRVLVFTGVQRTWFMFSGVNSGHISQAG